MRYFLEAVGFAVCMGVVIIFMAILMSWLEDKVAASILDPMKPENISDDIREIAERVETLLEWAAAEADYVERNGIDDLELDAKCGTLDEVSYRLRQAAKEAGEL